MAGPSTPADDFPIPFGVRADTGRPLNALPEEAITAMLGAAAEPNADDMALSDRSDASGVAFAVEGGIDANDLSQAGWGVIYSASVGQDIKDALRPLLD